MTAEAGIVDRDGRGLGVVAADLDDDGRIDLFVANDRTANFLFRNLGGLPLRGGRPLASGVAGNADGGYQAGMGVACGDLDGDGRPDLAVTNFYGESTTLYQNLGRAIVRRPHRRPSASPRRRRYLLGFGIAFLDVNNDGRLDLVDGQRPRQRLPAGRPLRHAARSSCRHGPGGRLVDVSGRAGAAWPVPRLGRGLAAGDLDNDGRVDLLVVAQDEPLAYFHNRTRAPATS